MQNNILLTGGSGLLGTELKKYLSCHSPPSSKLNVVVEQTPSEPSDYWNLIIHAAAYTDVTNAEKLKEQCFNVNVKGTMNMLKGYIGVPFVYISSEYAYNPVNYYSETKLAGETVVKAMAKKYLIIRTLFKPYPYPFERAFTDQMTQGDDVVVIAKLIAKAIKRWNRESKTIYVGTGRKTLFELAKKSRPDVKPNTTVEWSKVTGVKYPTDYL